jgi:hypothetical protein
MEKFEFSSPRGMPLFPRESVEDPCLTLEIYQKWYNLYVIHPDGRVEELDFAELDDRKGTPFCDHVPNPRKLIQLAKQRSW